MGRLCCYEVRIEQGQASEQVKESGNGERIVQGRSVCIFLGFVHCLLVYLAMAVQRVYIDNTKRALHRTNSQICPYDNEVPVPCSPSIPINPAISSPVAADYVYESSHIVYYLGIFLPSLN